MTRLAVIGSPIEHSLSPDLHRAAYKALGLNWNYEAYEVQQGDFDSFLRALSSEFLGISVTMPHKTNAHAAANTLDFTSKVTGSTNTLLFTYDGDDRQIAGFNTDVFGIVHAFKDAGVDKARHSVIVGAGATAASAVVASSELGAEHVTVIARSPEKASFLDAVALQSGISLSIQHLNDIDHVDTCDIAISTLPGTVEISLDSLKRANRATLLDVAYNPWPSAKATSWSERGGEVISGLRMLSRQALIQVRIFVNGSPEALLPDEEHVYEQMCKAIGLEPYI